MTRYAAGIKMLSENGTAVEKLRGTGVWLKGKRESRS